MIHDVLDVAFLVAEAIDASGSEYFIGGSVASSLQGEPRATNDIDFVVAMLGHRVRTFVERLGSDFEVDQAMLRDALSRGGSANIFYLPMVTKIDIFGLGGTPYDEVEFARRRRSLRPRAREGTKDGAGEPGGRMRRKPSSPEQHSLSFDGSTPCSCWSRLPRNWSLQMNKRIRKKLHKRYLELEVIDLSLIASWRARLFETPIGQYIPLDGSRLEGVPERLMKAIRRHRLEFEAARVPATEAEPWLSEGGLVVFRFRAREFPSIVHHSGNNPDAI
jgi:hypothetical protein